jgi:transcriptional regulator with XRE-family HTH domain
LDKSGAVVNRYSSKNPDPIDVSVGRRIRLRRRLLKISQEALGQAIGVTFQQIQKYEKGQNRVGCGRLWDFADALKVDISFFFQDLEEIDPSRTLVPRVQAEVGRGVGQSTMPSDPASRTETLELCQSFWKLKPAAREAFLNFLTVASRSPSGEELDGGQSAA